MNTVWLRDPNGYLYKLDEKKNRKYMDFVFDENTNEDEIKSLYRENCDGIRQYITESEDGIHFGPDFEGHIYYEDKTGIVFRRTMNGEHEYALSSSSEIFFIKPVDGLMFYVGKGLYRTKLIETN